MEGKQEELNLQSDLYHSSVMFLKVNGLTQLKNVTANWFAFLAVVQTTFSNLI